MRHIHTCLVDSFQRMDAVQFRVDGQRPIRSLSMRKLRLIVLQSPQQHLDPRPDSDTSTHSLPSYLQQVIQQRRFPIGRFCLRETKQTRYVKRADLVRRLSGAMTSGVMRHCANASARGIHRISNRQNGFDDFFQSIGSANRHCGRISRRSGKQRRRTVSADQRLVLIVQVLTTRRSG